MTKDQKINAAIKMVKPQIGSFDVESGDAWKTLASDIAYWLNEGDIEEEDTPETLARDIRSEFGGQIKQIGNH